MTSHTARLYALVGAVLVFFVAWAAIAARPWQKQSAVPNDPRLAALQVREQRVRAEALAVQRIVDRRWAAYRTQLAQRKQQIAAVRAANTKTRAASLASAPASPSTRARAARHRLPPCAWSRSRR